MSISEGNADQQELERAKILNRIIARIIDFIIVGILLEAVPRLGFFTGLTYLLIADGLFEGRSVGKRLIKLRVVHNKENQACGFRESIIRNFPFAVGYILMALPLLGFIFPILIAGFETLLMFGSERGMRLGDELAKTRVVEEPPEDSGNGQ
jgi:uncharacterized RDD family membrane protein YckC